LPRLVKHDARRIEVTKAAWRVIIRDGLDRTSIRAIAHELDLTTSVVTHYFRDKDALMSFILDTINDHLETRQQRNITSESGIERLEQLILSAFPLDEKGRTEWTIWMAFVGYAIGRETLLEAHRKRSRHNFSVIAAELEALKMDGSIRADVDAVFEAKTILAMIDGFGLNLVLDPEGFGADLSSQKFELLISSLIARLMPVQQPVAEKVGKEKSNRAK
jgi:AcrR family transcriptional regulator